MKKLWQKIAVFIIRRVQKHAPREVDILGRKYLTSEEVFNPKYFITSEFMANHISVTHTDDVLDMGTGSGLLAITAGQAARKVIAVDINPEAVRIAKENIEKHELESTVSVFQGDLFSSLPPDSTFDVILFSPPYLEGIPRDNLGYALYDPDKSLVGRFFKEARYYLNPEGYVQMAYSSIAESERVLKMATDLGWSCHVLAKRKGLFETYIIWKLTLPHEERTSVL